MAGHNLMDEFHLSVYAPGRLTAAEYDAMRLTLNAPHFRRRLERAVRRVVAHFPVLKQARIHLAQ